MYDRLVKQKYNSLKKRDNQISACAYLYEITYTIDFSDVHTQSTILLAKLYCQMKKFMSLI